METKTLFRKYCARLRLIGIIKSILLAFTLGLIVNFLTAFVLWFTHGGVGLVLGISLGVLAAITVIGAPVIYFTVFKPNTRMIARRLDKLGLQERMITMYEFEHDESYIAMLQRENAKEKLSGVKSRDIKFDFSHVAILLLAVSFVFASSMTTVSTLAAANYIGHGQDVITPEKPNENDKDDEEEEEEAEYFTVTYIAGENGYIEGEAVQTVKKGDDAEPVIAVPMEGYAFVAWSDGIMTAQRWDWDIMEDFEVEALFEPLPRDSQQGDGQEGEGQEGEGDGEGGGEQGGDQDGNQDGNQQGGDQPGGQGGEGEGSGGGQGEGGETQGGNGGSGEGEGGDRQGNSPGGESQGGDQSGDNPPSGDGNNQDGIGGGAGAGMNRDNNSIIDGQTDYKEAFDYEQKKNDLAGDDSIPPELKDILDGYLDTLKP